MTSIRYLIISLCLIVSAAPVIGQNVGNCTAKDESTRPDCPGAIVFFQKVQSAVEANRRAEVAGIIRYPITVFDGNKKLTIANRQQFLARYDLAFNPSMRCAIGKATTSQVWGNYQGFTFDSGEIWWDAIIPEGEKPDPSAKEYWTKYPFKIIAINNESALMNGCPSWPPKTNQ